MDRRGDDNFPRGPDGIPFEDPETGMSYLNRDVDDLTNELQYLEKNPGADYGRKRMEMIKKVLALKRQGGAPRYDPEPVPEYSDYIGNRSVEDLTNELNYLTANGHGFRDDAKIEMLKKGIAAHTVKVTDLAPATKVEKVLDPAPVSAVGDPISYAFTGHIKVSVIIAGVVVILCGLLL